MAIFMRGESKITTNGNHNNRSNHYMMRSILIFCFINLLIACQSDADKADVTSVELTDSTIYETVDTLLTSPTIQLFDNAGWTEILTRSDPGFDWSKFTMINTWKEDSMITAAFEPDSDFLKKDKKLLKYSPDNRYLLDLDSYAVPVKEGESRKNVRGPDTEVSLIDEATKIKTRLLFMGPAASVEDGGWIDNNNIVLLGMEERKNDGMKIPVIWKYHLPTKSFYLYEYAESIRYYNQ